MDEEAQEGKSSTFSLLRYRSPKFSREEVEALLNIVGRYKYTICNKSTSNSVNQAKDLCWEKIARIFNSKGFKCERSPDSLKTKWENLKRGLRKLPSNLMDETYSGDDDVSKQIAKMIIDVENNAPAEGQNLDEDDEFHDLVLSHEKIKPNLKRKHDFENFEAKESGDSNDGDDDKRRYRSPTFSREEVEALLNIVGRYKYTICNKSTSATANQAKDLCWEKVARIFNSKGFTYERSPDSLKTKWENLKRRLKKLPSNAVDENNSGDDDLSRQIANMMYDVENKAPAEIQDLDEDDELNDGDDDKRSNRSLNFAPQECGLLLECVRTEKKIVFSKDHDAHAIGLKNRAWRRITDAFNAKSPQKRSQKVLRTKFNNLKGLAKSMGFKDAVKSFDRNDVKHEKLVNESATVIKSEPVLEFEIEPDFEHNSDSNHFASDPLSTVLNSDSGISSIHSSSSSQENKEVVKLKLELLNYKMETARLERQRLQEASRADAAAREARAATAALGLRAARLQAVAAAESLPRDHPALLFTAEERPAERYLRRDEHT